MTFGTHLVNDPVTVPTGRIKILPC